MARITVREAISQALWEEMERDPNVFIMGEEVGVWGGTYAVTKGFYDHFGADRVRDTPIAEAAIIGAAIGVSLTGLRSISRLLRWITSSMRPPSSIICLAGSLFCRW